MNQMIIILPIAIVTGLIGLIFGGIAEDALWLAVDGTLPDCENMKNDWEKTCRDTYRGYYTGKTMLQTFGFFAPFSSVIAIFRKLEG